MAKKVTVKDNGQLFVDGVLALAEKLNITLFTEYNHLCIKDKGKTSKYNRFEDYVTLPDSQVDAEEIFGIDYNSMSLEELRALIKDK